MIRLKSKRIALSLLATTALCGLIAQPADAQTKRPMPDEHGIDVISGQPYIPSGSLTVGDPAQGGLQFYRVWQGNGNVLSSLTGTVSVSGTAVTVTIGASVETFTQSGTTYTSDDGHGSTLVNVSTIFTYTLADGTAYQFENPGALADTPGVKGLLYTITRPNGQVTTFTNKYQYFCERSGSSCIGQSLRYARLQSVTTNTGYQLHLDHALDFANPNPPADIGRYDPTVWQEIKAVTGINNAVEYCDPNANTCSLTQSWPKATITQTAPNGSRTDTWVDSLNNTTTSQVAGSGLTSIQSPANPSTDFTLSYNANGLVGSFAQGGGTWNYTYADVGTQRTTTVTQPLGGSKVYVSDTSLRKLQSVTDELGHTTSYTYDSFVRPTQVTKPEGNYTLVTYDARGNVTQARNVAKSGSGLSDIVSSANFDTTCSNPKTCNKPNSTIDARSNQTDYTYDSTHGGLLTVTRPAPTTGATRPQSRFGYTALFAYYKNSAGTIVAAPSSIYKLTSVSACQTGSSCAGTSDEVKSTIAYGSTGVANNLLPTSTTSGGGDGVLTATISRTYDNVGNLTLLDGPLAGVWDSWGFNFDADRQLTLLVSPDPDSAGTMPRRAQRYTYDANGNVTKIEQGTASSYVGPFTADPSGIREEIAYDSLGRKVTDSAASGASTINTLTQYNYDTAGRLNCTAVRMNPAIYGSLPADACTLGTSGSFGPDRISQIVYDNASEPLQNKFAVGTSDAAAERTLTYSNNGKVTTLTDGENNKTTTVYDGFDRPSQTQYPSATKGSGTSNSSDYEQLGYDANSNVTSRRLRDGNSLGFTFDNLNRVTLKDLPGSEPDVTYAYDNLGRLTSASQTGNALSFTYDALSRQLTETGPQGTATSAYDLAGHRTQLSYPGTGLYVNTDYLVTGEPTAIRENGATSGVGVLATYAYDNLGRRTGVTYGNGAAQAFTYDPVSRLASLTNDLTGTANDLSVTFAYNPASQITSTVRTGDAYAYTAMGNGSTAFTQNGLNQQISIGGSAATWDSKGNLTSEPQSGKTYGYSSENLMTSASGGVTLGYDPGMRLYQVAGASATRFAYDGANAIADYDGSNVLQHRYVFAPGIDQPILQYDGSGTTTRKFLSSDGRGSIVSATDSSGTLVGINAYDEYGKPGASNIGRFQYTGQMWLSEIGAYYYKARVYLPHLGIFAQTDPIGTDGGVNLYAYTGDDPVNFSDPLGLKTPAAASCGPSCNIYDPQFDPWRITITAQRIQRDLEAFVRQIDRLSKQLGVGDGRRDDRDGAQEKKLPACAQNFLASRISGSPASITLHNGGSLINNTGNSVTYGSDIYLAGNDFNRRDPNAMITKFHEIWHTSQNASMNLSPLEHAVAYAAFWTGALTEKGIHDASPLEKAADDFALAAYNAYHNAGLDKTCPF